ncbi:hypothetical protein WICMUC_000152 [Wickerhamomyces mucosus]|uniref:Uncharacterized protein n=1 Tax=Wickerhamomyces mucosus TaxID=1378264 RepID=A0A9P8PYR7_9ASCO|nr:hypothetical protein WICMUC_000152 [Wickerhamomyces mucosus]
MPSRHDPTKLYKHQINHPIQIPYKLGPSATWSKIKYIHSQGKSGLRNVNQSSSSSSSSKSISSTTTNSSLDNKTIQKTLNNGNNHHNGKIIKFGLNGELFIGFDNSIQVWDWKPSALEIRSLELKSQKFNRPIENQDNIHNNSNNNIDHNEYEDIENDYVLYLVSSLNDIDKDFKIIDFYPIEIDQDRNTYKVLIMFKTCKNNEISIMLKKFGQVFTNDDDINISNKLLILPPFIHGGYPFIIKHSTRYIGISTDEGCLTIFDELKKHPLSLGLNVDMINGEALFDIVGRFLVYVPNQSIESGFEEDENIAGFQFNDYDYDNINIVDNSSSTKLNFSKNSTNYSNYSKIVKNLSNSAIDSISKISANYLMSSGAPGIPSTTTSSSINKFKSQFSNFNIFNQQSNPSQSVIIIDLEQIKTIGIFKPPNGVSNLSLCPFNNSYLITTSKRGDLIYKWDLTRLPKEINLLDLQTRGKTNSIISKINWTSINSFQIITQNSGSLHNFNSINPGNLNWILPNLNSKLISSIDSNSLSNYNNRHNVKKIIDNNSYNVLLSIIENDLYLINLLTGDLKFKFLLPKSQIPKSLLPDYIPLKPVNEIVIRNDSNSIHSNNMRFQRNNSNYNISLSQIEIDTFLQTPPLITYEKFEMNSYQSNSENFWDDFDKGLDIRNFQRFSGMQKEMTNDSRYIYSTMVQEPNLDELNDALKTHNQYMR